jgi:SAM-dependent methyltransferase
MTRERTSDLSVLYPELRAGGFSRVDGTVAFYTRVRALVADLPAGATVLDYGAGRGAFLEDPVPYRRRLRHLSESGVRVVGVDVDGAVFANPSLDAAHLLEAGWHIPLEDSSVDMIVSDFTFEHIDEPARAAAELDRVLRPGGWICARTPNRRGYIALGARIVPNALHVAVLRRLQPRKAERDTFPTRYGLNTARALERHFPPDRFDHIVWMSSSEPNYAGGSQALARLTRVLLALTPAAGRPMMNAFMRKRP